MLALNLLCFSPAEDNSLSLHLALLRQPRRLLILILFQKADGDLTAHGAGLLKGLAVTHTPEERGAPGGPTCLTTSANVVIGAWIGEIMDM